MTLGQRSNNEQVVNNLQNADKFVQFHNIIAFFSSKNLKEVYQYIKLTLKLKL